MQQKKSVKNVWRIGIVRYSTNVLSSTNQTSSASFFEDDLRDQWHGFSSAGDQREETSKLTDASIALLSWRWYSTVLARIALLPSTYWHGLLFSSTKSAIIHHHHRYKVRWIRAPDGPRGFANFLTKNIVWSNSSTWFDERSTVPIRWNYFFDHKFFFPKLLAVSDDQHKNFSKKNCHN